MIPEGLLKEWNHRSAGAAAQAAWNELFGRYRAAFPQLAAELERRSRGDLPQKWSEIVNQAQSAAKQESKPQATRQTSQSTLNVIGPLLPEFLGGSADLTGSNNTQQKNSTALTPKDFSGHYIHYGVREFGMTAIMNGMALHGGYIPYGGTFLVFSDYARNAVRLAALMRQRVILVYTHDSIGLGEDGPTHQPIEHLTGLRAMPNLSLWRPCDAFETAVAWIAAHRAPRPHGARAHAPGAAAAAAQRRAARRDARAAATCSSTAKARRSASSSRPAPRSASPRRR